MDFMITAKRNMLIRPGRRVKILTRVGIENRKPVSEWKSWTVVREYANHVLMRSEKGYRECFTYTDIEQMIARGEMK